MISPVIVEAGCAEADPPPGSGPGCAAQHGGEGREARCRTPRQ